MINRLVLLILNIFDLVHKKKILHFFKIKKKKFGTIIDVGGHVGETIELFLKNFEVNKIISFEASPINFKKLKSNNESFTKKFKNTKIYLENVGVGNSDEIIKINQFLESSSSTLKPIDEESSYFKKKFFFLRKKNDGKLYYKIDIKIVLLRDYLINNKIEKIDLLKIDTEGYEYEVILGLREEIKKVEYIYFEHHFDNMILKNYKLRDINQKLLENNFKQVFKIKMPFRKTFEYIYKNKSL